MGIFDQMSQAIQMRNEAKKMQAEIKKIQCEYSNGGITVVARGDFTVASIKISEEAWKEAAGGKPERFETMLFNVVNGALKQVKKTTQEQMMALMKSNGSLGGGLKGLFGR